MKKVLISLAVMVSMAIGVIAQPAWAEGTLCTDPNIPPELTDAAGCNTTTSADAVVNNVIEIVIGVLGLVAVFVMIYGGFTYMTSTGDASKVQRGKNIIIYGLVGLVVAILAYAIVKFVGGAIGR